ncbi:MAG: Eco57I restriction-modification methylase domain-containing protein [Magnetococcales bacterium]|nr:Eco57I restriction-modification methylase domain-containing protein [Magnetococcales bacterium]
MSAPNPIETRRLLLQTSCDSDKTQRERNRLGQFATPTELATDVLQHAYVQLPTDLPVRFLDPAIGTGSFYSALLRVFPSARIAKAVGYEIDDHYGRPARTLWQGHRLDLKLEDFTTARSPNDGEKFNLIICNPPYVRHHHIGISEKNRLQAAVMDACGVKMAGLTGLYCYFLGLAHTWLADDGIAGWLIPSEFMDVNYGEPVKQYLLNQVELLRIHRFNPNDLQFGDALVSSSVVWFRKHRATTGHEVEFSYGGTLAKPSQSRFVPAVALQAEAKWSRFPISDVRMTATGPTLGDFFKIQRGIATGNNKFFIKSRADIATANLPPELFKPILPGPRHVLRDIIEAEADGTPKLDRQLFILDCRLPEMEIQRRYPSLWEYLQAGKPDVSGRYLCRYRSPWYAQENRPAAPFVCTYMGRGNASHGRPFRFILNLSQATVANVYLMLYPKPPLACALADNRELARKIWGFLNSIETKTLLGEGRVYGGGLYKMEPRELANVPAGAIAAMLPTE